MSHRGSHTLLEMGLKRCAWDSAYMQPVSQHVGPAYSAMSMFSALSGDKFCCSSPRSLESSREEHLSISLFKV